jgi:hypothetical protein
MQSEPDGEDANKKRRQVRSSKSLTLPYWHKILVYGMAGNTCLALGPYNKP